MRQCGAAVVGWFHFCRQVCWTVRRLVHFISACGCVRRCGVVAGVCGGATRWLLLGFVSAVYERLVSFVAFVSSFVSL